MNSYKSWDVSAIVSQINRLSSECSKSYNAVNSFELKKDLYLIKDIVDAAIADAPSFGELEELWLKGQEQKRIINILKQNNIR